MPESLSVALVGPGAIGERHVAAFRAADAHVAAVVGAHEEEAEEFAKRHGIPFWSAELDEVLARPEVDAIVIASPNQLHAAQTTRALEAGKPVLCEIPCALTLVDAMRLAELADAAALPLMIAHSYRFAEPYLRLREFIDEGLFDVRHLVGTQLNLRHENVGWTGRRRDWTDDVLWHHSAHLVDIALWLLDSTEVRVHGTVGPRWPGSAKSMDVAAVLEAPDGDLATLALSYHSRISFNHLMVVGEDRTFRIDDGRLTSDDEVLVDSGGTDAMMLAAMVRQAEEFVSCVLAARPPLFGIVEALPTVRVLDTVQSQRGGGE